MAGGVSCGAAATTLGGEASVGCGLVSSGKGDELAAMSRELSPLSLHVVRWDNDESNAMTPSCSTCKTVIRLEVEW